MAATSELNFSKLLLFIQSIQSKLELFQKECDDNNTCTLQQMNESIDKNNIDMRDEIAKQIKTVMDSYQSLSVEDQNSTLKLFIGDMIMRMVMDNIMTKCKEYADDDELKTIMEEKIQQLMSENCKLEAENASLSSLLEDKSADVVFLTDKIGKMKDLMKRMGERIQVQQQHIEYLQQQELNMMGMIDKDKHLATH